MRESVAGRCCQAAIPREWHCVTPPVWGRGHVVIKYTTRVRMTVSMAQGVGTFNCHRRFHMAMQRGAHHGAAAQRTAQNTLELLWRTSSTSIAHLSANAKRRPPLRCGAAAGGLTPSSGISEARPRRAPACVVSLTRTHAPIHECQCDGVGEHHVADRPHDHVVTRGARAKPK